MASLGVQVYRLSVEWARLEPRPGVWDDAAFARYREEPGACCATGGSALS